MTEMYGYVNAASAVCSDGSKEVSSGLQKLIDENPNRVIFFPDGIYRLGEPVLTPADPTLSVSLLLSEFAVIKADEGWNSDEAMIRLGAGKPFNTIYINGSNYSISGGIIDGSGVASAISVDSGRETSIHNISIKHAKVGIHIKPGCNSNSSDTDVRDVNIVGNGTTGSVGLLVEGHDNTFTNMRIARVFTGVELRSSGNSLRNIHPLYTSDYTDYPNSCGFLDVKGNNWYSYAYSDQFGNGFRFGPDARGSILSDCFCYWYSPKGDYETMIKCDGKFKSVVRTPKVGFRSGPGIRSVLTVGDNGGCGYIENLCLNSGHDEDLGDRTFREYLRGDVMF